MRKAALRFDLCVLFLSLLAIFATGCANHTKTANKIKDDIHGKTAEIAKAATDASTHIADADKKLAVATTQPGMPPTANKLLTGARGDLASAQQSLAPIVPATAVIDGKADDAAKETQKAVDETNRVKDGWGYKLQRFVHFTFWGIVIALPLIAVVLFMVKTNGGGPILAALGEMFGDLLKAAWRGLKWCGKALLHLVTLGSLALADKTNKHYDAQEAAKKAAPQK